MRSFLLTGLCLFLVAACALFAQREAGGPVAFRVALVEGDTGEKMAGIVRVLVRESGKPVKLDGLLDRMRGFKTPDIYGGWHVLPAEGARLSLPPGQYTLEALGGLETEKASRALDLTGKPPEEIKVPLAHVFRPEKWNLVAGNTHLHLMKLGKEESDAYLSQVPGADRLKVLFISYLERKPDDKDYITNTYPVGDLKSFGDTVLVNNGEEHRHNFKGYGQGYGHVMLLNIKRLVRPVSIGPGIMGEGFDDTPLKPGIEEARKQGGTVIWCHNSNGHEDVLNALAGRLDALNVYDGGNLGDYEANYYRYLNVGVRLPISTGTDWFMYDFSRVYADLGSGAATTIPAWLDAVKQGRCQATNGPLLDLRVDGQGLGGSVKLDKPRRIKIEAGGRGRLNFGKLELIHNGKVIETKNVAGAKAPFETSLAFETFVDQPGWFAMRVNTDQLNEMGKKIFAHTSPVYVDLEGKKPFQVDDALELLKQMEEGAAAIRAQGTFSGAEARTRLLALYDDACAELGKKIAAKRKAVGE